jgi:hypothetical protein
LFFYLFAMVWWCLFLPSYYDRFAMMNKPWFSRLRTRSGKVKYPLLMLRLIFRENWNFCYCIIPNNILDKISCESYPCIRSEWVVLFTIIFWILTLYKFFILILKWVIKLLSITSMDLFFIAATLNNSKKRMPCVSTLSV